MAEVTSTKVFPPGIIEDISSEIALNDGNEVFFKAVTDKLGKISEVTPLAWGNKSAVPALLNQLTTGNIIIHNHPSGDLTPSYADIQIASVVGNRGSGFYIVDNDVSAVKIVVDRYVKKGRIPINIEEMESELGEDSEIAKKLPDFEPRPGQVEMTAEVARCFNDENSALIEAGTGTGKTLAYLLPSVKWALKNKERVLISTNTINLQEQLIYKDIPFLQTVTEDKFKAVLVKGRGNYVCLRKIESEEYDLEKFQQDAFENEKDELAVLIKWAKNTKDGTLSDLNIVPQPGTWDKIKCDSDTCTGVKCSHYENCFLVNARREAAESHIMVVNHHLLFADLSLRGPLGSAADVAVLPPYTRIIVDEAHHIEAVSTEYFGAQISQFGTKLMLSRLLTYSKKREERGILPLLKKKLSAADSKRGVKSSLPLINIIDEKIIPPKNEIAKGAEDFFDEISAFLQKNLIGGGDDRQHRLDERFNESKEWQNTILNRARGLLKQVREFIGTLSDLNDSVKDIDNGIKKEFESSVLEIDANLRRLGEFSESLYYLLFDDDKSMIRWIEQTGKQRSIKICAAPIEVKDHLKNSLFDPFDTVIMTSATLAVGGSFDYINSRLGLDRLPQDKILYRIFVSPFDFQSQAMIGIPTDINEPNHPQFEVRAHDYIERSIEISDGRAFALFTSYGAMNRAFEDVSDRSNGSRISFLKQGSDTRHNLIKRFRGEQPSTLFATDSFWEGVDVIGDALSSIIIARLPFRVPTVPIEVARREAIDAAGGNSFTDYTIPQAVIKFKQGFGRLIRHKKDRGTILILDNRIISKGYGRVFLNSLPDCKVIKAPGRNVFDAFYHFYASVPLDH